MAKVCPLFSSSSGNSIYISGAGSSILIDVGVSAKQMNLALCEIGVDPWKIDAIFITHEHSDHIKGLRVFASKYNIDVYASQGTLKKLNEMEMLRGFKYEIMPKEGIAVKDGIFVTSSELSHDCSEGLCYKARITNDRSVAVLTDSGILSQTAEEFISGSDYILIESNHDVGMLQNGAYPYYLKRRILSEKGHLSNAVCSAAVSRLIQKGTTRFTLGHLSRENNYPALAYESSHAALSSVGAVKGRDYILTVAAEKCRTGVTVL